jgi:hypothetical protein
MMVYTVINASTGDLRFHLYDPCLAFLVQGIAARLGKRTPEEPALAEDNLDQIFEEPSELNVGEVIRVGVYQIPAKPA